MTNRCVYGDGYNTANADEEEKGEKDEDDNTHRSLESYERTLFASTFCEADAFLGFASVVDPSRDPNTSTTIQLGTLLLTMLHSPTPCDG